MDTPDGLRILVTVPVGRYRTMFFPPDVIRRINSLGPVTWTEGEARLTAAELERRMKDSQAWIFGRGDVQIRLTRARIEDSPCRFIGYTGGSLKRLLAEDAFDAGVPIVCGNDAFAAPLAEMTLLLMLMTLRRSGELIVPMITKSGFWPREKVYTESLLGKTVGLLGFGMIAERLLEMLRPFGVSVLVSDPYFSSRHARERGVEAVDVDDLFRRSEVVSIHHTLTRETYHLVTKERLALLRDGAVLVNTARGKIVDQEALAAELASGRISAGLDVYESEPLPHDHPLRRLPNVVTTPHCGGATMKCYREQVSFVVDDLEAFADGRPLAHEVSKERFRRMSEH